MKELIIVQGVVKEFEDSSRGGVRSEVAGVGKVVLGGLMWEKEECGGPGMAFRNWVEICMIYGVYDDMMDQMDGWEG